MEQNEKLIADVFEKVGLAKIVREQGNDELTIAVQSAMIELAEQIKKIRSEEYTKGFNDCLLGKQKGWSDGDEELLDSIIKIVCGVGSQPNGLREKQVNWLKSLHHSWKPSEELEEEMKRFIDAHYHTRFDETLENGNDPLTVFDFEDIARHFAEWGAEHLRDSTKKIDKSLEEYASRAGFDYVDGIVQEEPGHRWNDHDVEFAYRDGIIAGAEWQASQMPMPEDTVLFNKGVAEGRRLEREDMLKDAVVGIAQPDDCEIWVNLVGYGYKFNEGDKVRIIIVKDESK